ncbi:MAG: response regulator transcription factor [Bacteroidota bacterium]|nr:response regulator transcription factor [Bacteroidota bacterium]MDX5429499.1 response regulator transcription factor [Bacteroidota bacterium]MDX5468284.1 response regulator transcription factor [Bacteroidota bacterium]
MSRSIKVILADGQKLLSDSLRLALNQQEGIEVKQTVDSGASLIKTAEKSGADLVITEMALGDADGVAIIQKLKRQNADLRVMLLTQMEDSGQILKAVDYNVDGIQLKNCSLDDLVVAIRIVASGQKFYAPEVLKMIASRPPVESQAGLSAREVEIMQMLAEGLSAREIGDRLLISSRTVETHKANIMRKLNVKKATHLVKIAFDRGLVKAAR